ncbi:MAG: hypothetical protein FWB86_07185 [Treponema sp.]|nr:hypothetical protein [Treponema sp.]MCL2252008.1 hypothetical protein [Treponema sp.]
MATTKKPTAEQTDAKKPAAKPAAKSAAKKPAAKPAATSAAKKPAAATGTKKPAAKPAAKKPAAAAGTKKPAAKSAAKKPAAAKKTSTKKAPADNVKFRNLFDAYKLEKLPRDQGYIISSFFKENDAYSIYEVVSYAGVKEIYPTDTGLTFVSGSKKLYILVEPAIYHQKGQEPVSRKQGDSIPKRFNELEIIIAKNQTKIMVAKEPNEVYGSFTILKPASLNFSVVFYELPELYDTVAAFFTDSLNKQRKVPERDARTAANLIVETIKKTMGFEGQYS